MPQVQIRTKSGKIISSNDTRPEDIAKDYVTGYDISKNLKLPPEDILRDYEKFWKWNGGVLHPRLRDKQGRLIRILKPFWYQTKFAEMNRAVMLGSNKLAKTKGELIRDIQTRLWP